MVRAPFQVLVFPYRFLSDGTISFALFQRNEETGGYWQAVSGGGEDQETALETAKRELMEETGLGEGCSFQALDSRATIPVVNVCGFKWGDDILVIPEHSFGVEVGGQEITLSTEHTDYKWTNFDEAMKLLQWDSNKSALWELNHRLQQKGK